MKSSSQYHLVGILRGQQAAQQTQLLMLTVADSWRNKVTKNGIKATYLRVTHPQFFRTFGGCLDTCIVYTGKRNWETKLQNITQSFDDPFGSWPQGKELLHPSGGARWDCLLICFSSFLEFCRIWLGYGFIAFETRGPQILVYTVMSISKYGSNRSGNVSTTQPIVSIPRDSTTWINLEHLLKACAWAG